MTTPWSPAPSSLGAHPELGHIALLAHQLDVLTAVLTQVHGEGGPPEALTHHARGMVQVIRVLQLQLDAYREMIALPTEPKRRRPGKA